MKRLGIALAVGIVLFPVAAEASEGHGDPSAPVLLGLAVILVAAKLGGGLFQRLSLPPVLGELICCMVALARLEHATNGLGISNGGSLEPA